MGKVVLGTTTIEDCLTGLMRALLPELEPVVPIYSLSVAVCPLPDTDLTYRKCMRGIRKRCSRKLILPRDV